MAVADYETRRTLMVDTQVRPSDVTKFPIIEALLAVPKEDYVPDAQRETAYVGAHIPIGGGRVILEPRSFAKMLEAAELQPEDVVLDLGCGLGYSTAVLARMVQFVIALEEDETRAQDAQTLLSSRGIDNAAVLSAPLAEGAAAEGPYDVILLEGGIEQFPTGLMDQVKDGGRVVAIFVEGGFGHVQVGLKSGDVLHWRRAFDAHAPVLPGFEVETAFSL